jgi:hypothetical protein
MQIPIRATDLTAKFLHHFEEANIKLHHWPTKNLSFPRAQSFFFQL